jgi:hypothetical protein
MAVRRGMRADLRGGVRRKGRPGRAPGWSKDRRPVGTAGWALRCLTPRQDAKCASCRSSHVQLCRENTMDGAVHQATMVTVGFTSGRRACYESKKRILGSLSADSVWPAA